MNTKEYIAKAIKAKGADVIAKEAGVSRATLFRASAGGNIGIDLLQRILSAAGYSLVVSAAPGDHPQQRASGE